MSIKKLSVKKLKKMKGGDVYAQMIAAGMSPSAATKALEAMYACTAANYNGTLIPF